MRRLFVAVEIPDGIRALLARLGESLGRVLPEMKWVDPANLHVTVKFLGNTPEEQVPQVKALIARAVAGVAPTTVEVAGLGAFPTLRKARVVWVGLHGDLGPLEELVARLDAGLAPLGFEPEKRRFAAHVTLGRSRRGRRPPDLERVCLPTADALGCCRVEEVVLVESELTRTGPIYTALERFRIPPPGPTGEPCPR